MQAKRIERLVEKHIKSWSPILGLQNYEIRTAFVNETRTTGAGFKVIAETIGCWHMLLATMTFYIPSMRDLTKRDIELTVVHELIHIVIDEASECTEKHIERVCECLSRAFMRLKKQVK